MPMPRDYVFEPIGANRDFFCCRDPEVLNWGAAGSAKSITCLNKLDYLCSKYDGIRCLIVRKTRASLTNSTMVSFEDKVIREGSSVTKEVLQRKNRTSYRYPNKSEIVVGGLDNPENILSTEYDVIYTNEVTQLTESEYEMLIGRNRNNKMPYQQVISDCNPGSKTHWMRKRMDRDRLDVAGNPTGKKMVTAFRSTHQDNPFYWDAKKRSWTEPGLAYIAKLSNYTGVMRKRYFEGEWVSSEGIVYPEFDPSIHIVSRKDMPIIPHHWPHYLTIDWGFINPLSAVFAAVDPKTSAIYVYREHYQTKITVPEHAKIIKKLSYADPQFQAIICDHDAGDRATFEACTGWGTIPANKKSKEMNIQELRDRLVPDKYGNCGIYFLDDMLVARDKEWEELGNPVGAIEEFGAYSYRPQPDLVSGKEIPYDKWDHSLDCLSYLCMHIANHHGEWRGTKLLDKTTPSITTTDPTKDKKLYPFNRLFPINVGEAR